MKVIDLLNTPLDELPKKIKMEDKTYTLFIDEDTNYHYYQDDKCKYFMFSISCFEKLNEEVEIIEEDKKIEKIEMVGCNMKVNLLENETFLPVENLQTEFIIGKINEIIDKMEK